MKFYRLTLTIAPVASFEHTKFDFDFAGFDCKDAKKQAEEIIEDMKEYHIEKAVLVWFSKDYYHRYTWKYDFESGRWI